MIDHDTMRRGVRRKRSMTVASVRYSAFSRKPHARSAGEIAQPSARPTEGMEAYAKASNRGKEGRLPP